MKRFIESPAPTIRRIHTMIEQTHRREGPLLIFTRYRGKEASNTHLPTEPHGTPVSLGLFNRSLATEAPVIYAVDQGSDYRALTARYPKHQPYVLFIPGADVPESLRPSKVVLRPWHEHLRTPQDP